MSLEILGIFVNKNLNVIKGSWSFYYTQKSLIDIFAYFNIHSSKEVYPLNNLY